VGERSTNKLASACCGRGVRAHILVVGQQSELADRVQNSLSSDRLRLSIFRRLDNVEQLLADDRPDLVIGMLLSHYSLLHLCGTLRANRRTRSITILILAGEGYSRTQLLEAFNAGADDCLVVPFSLAEMLARVNALLRRTIQSEGSGLLSFGELELDRAGHRVLRGKTLVHLTAREFALLEALLERPGHVLSRAQLQKAGWARAAPANERNVDAVIARINKALRRNKRHRLIQAVRGEGYVLGPAKP
jgi:two-component system, OmpR family, phosphate regulon response regulator PhoB